MLKSRKNKDAKFYKCTCMVCGKRYSTTKELDCCPICSNPVDKGIDFFDVWNLRFEKLDNSNHGTF
ncbi:MAG: hypothetical protein ACFFD4_28410 [Candidatus Odinarchaeota archaeon]